MVTAKSTILASQSSIDAVVLRMRLNIAFMVLVAVGCGTIHLDGEMSPEIDDTVDESSQDSGPLVIDESPAVLDAGSTPGADGGSDERDSGSLSIDAEVGDDAGEDASVGMCTGDLTEPVAFGTAQEPNELAASEVTFEGQIDWRGRAFARITGVAPGTHYVITASAGSKLVLSAFTDDTTFTDAACVSGDEVVERESLCLVTAAGESIDVAIDAFYVSESFTLTITPAYPSEGTSAAPIQIAASDLPYDLEVNAEVANFYEITGLTPWESYVVSARAAVDAVLLEVYENGSFSGSATDKQMFLHANAIGTPQGSSLFVTLRARDTGTTAELDVQPVMHETEGTAFAPIQVAASALPFAGEVGWSYNTTPGPVPIPRAGGVESFYEITGLTPGTYVLKVDGATAPVLVLLEAIGGLSSATLPHYVSAYEDVPAQITRRITGSTLSVGVKNQGGAGTAFTLDLEPAAHVSVGTETAPLEIPHTELPYGGEIEPNIYSYYKITGLTPGQAYLARATGVTEAAVGILFIDDATGQACEIQAQTGTSGRTCTIVPSGTSARIQARVFGYTNHAILGSVFMLSLEPIVEQSLGTPDAPVVIDCPSGTYASQIGTNGASYYEITGLECIS
jgi:hypothetical protein